MVTSQSKGVARPAPLRLPESRILPVRSYDGTRIHAEVFGPEDGYPIVLSHGITCALRVWHEQINDLAVDHRVIAFDHRGHGRSGVPRRGSYSLGHLAADLDSVLAAALRDGERAVIAGHSMGGITIAAWSDHYRDKVTARAAAVAMVNTTVGDVLSQVKLLRVPERYSAHRVRVVGRTLKTFGGVPTLRAVHRPSKRFVQQIAVGRDADPAVVDLVYELFAATPRLGRGGCARMIVDAMGPGQDIDVSGLSVPTLVIGSTRDKLLPFTQSRRIAETVPNLVELVELPGGHCAILERPADVTARLRSLVESVRTTQEG